MKRREREQICKELLEKQGKQFSKGTMHANLDARIWSTPDVQVSRNIFKNISDNIKTLRGK